MRPKVVDDDKLLELMLRAFARDGFEATSMRQLCRRLGFSHNLIHERYKSKDEAWQAAVDHGFSELRLGLHGVQVDRYEDDLELLREYLRMYARMVVAYPDTARVVYREAAVGGERWDYMWTRYIEPSHRLASQLVLDLQRKGRFREGPVDVVYFFLANWGIGGLSAVDQAVGPPTPNDESRLDAAYLAVEVLLDGLAARTD